MMVNNKRAQLGDIIHVTMLCWLATMEAKATATCKCNEEYVSIELREAFDRVYKLGKDSV